MYPTGISSSRAHSRIKLNTRLSQSGLRRPLAVESLESRLLLSGASLGVTAEHLGGGAVQYTLNANNDLGGAIAVQITAVGDIVQGRSTFTNPEAGAPDGGSDTKSQADSADNVGAFFGLPFETYNAFNGNGGLDPGGNGGSVWDSWWDNTAAFTNANPPFSAVLSDAAVGGNIGSTQFSFSAGTAGGSDISSARIGQIVILDPAAAGLPLGPLSVNNTAGIAQMDIIDIIDVGPLNFLGESLIAALGDKFSITGTFSVGEVPPEPPARTMTFDLILPSFPLSYTEEGLTVTASSSQLRITNFDGLDGDNELWNPALAGPYVFDMGGVPFTLKRVDVINTPGEAVLTTFVASPSGATAFLSGNGTKFFPAAGFSDITSVQWNQPFSTTAIDNLVFSTEQVSVDLDIKPGSDPNSINLSSNGVQPVAILTTADFDATTVDTSDLSTILFGDPGVVPRVSPLSTALEDVDGDGDTDLIMHFSTPEITSSGALLPVSTEAALTGVLTDGTPFQGADSVLIVPPGDANNDQIVNAADYTIWADNFGKNGAKLTDGDFNGDRLVDASDYTIWADNFGVGVSAPAAAALAVSSEAESSLVLLAVDRVLSSAEMNWALYMLLDDLLDDETDEQVAISQLLLPQA